MAYRAPAERQAARLRDRPALECHDVDPDNDLKQVAGQVLVVTRLGPGGVCHIGYIDGRANPNANELAAELADKHARAFKCGKDKPITLGIQGKGFSGLYGG